MFKKITTPLDEQLIQELKAGDRVLISGIIYAARDAAHKKMTDALAAGEDLPFDINGQVIYYAGPCPPKPGMVAGPFGPTTSGRMDRYTPALLDQGLKGMIGKGLRDAAVIDGMRKHKAVYFAAIGGIGALIASTIKSLRTVAYEELGAEALVELQVEDFPAIVAIDCTGRDLYDSEPPKYIGKFEECINEEKVLL